MKAPARGERRGLFFAMKVAMLAPCWYSVPPAGYGGIETIVHLLTEELIARGDAVTLYSVGSSRSRAAVRAYYPEEQYSFLGNPDQVVVESAHALFAYRDIAVGDFDIVHDHAGHVGAALAAALEGAPVLHTVHGAFNTVNRPLYRLLGESARLHFNAISDYQRRQAPELPFVGRVHNAIDPSLYPLVRGRREYLLEISRICREKGQHLAIALARRAGLPLKLAGKVENTPAGRLYFAEEIKPQLGGPIEYVGEVNLAQKVELLTHARAFIFPVHWDEPFGLVTIEALASGTPVIAMPQGALPEIIRDGIEGFLVKDLDGMVKALERLDQIDPVRCRRRVEEAFSPPVMTDGYQELYQRVLGPAKQLLTGSSSGRAPGG